MFILLLIVTIAVFLLILATSAIKPHRSSLSLFELKRRIAADDNRAEISLQRESYFTSVLALRDLIVAVLFLVLFSLLIVNFAWWPGVFLCLAAILLYIASFNVNLFDKLSDKMYRSIEKSILNFCAKHRMFVKFIGSRHYDNDREAKIGSSFEFLHLIKDASPTILSQDDKRLILGSMSLKERLVSEIMIPRKDITSVKTTELLGPLVLDDLHRAGHKQVLVTGETIDDIIGVLTLNKMLNVDRKRSLTAGKAFDQPVFFIGDDQTLEQTLVEFLKTDSRLLVVTNFDRRTVGLVTLSDVMTALFGRDLRW